MGAAGPFVEKTKQLSQMFWHFRLINLWIDEMQEWLILCFWVLSVVVHRYLALLNLVLFLFPLLFEWPFSWSWWLQLTPFKLSSTLSFKNLSNFSNLIMLLSHLKAPQWFSTTYRTVHILKLALRLQKLVPVYLAHLTSVNIFAHTLYPIGVSTFLWIKNILPGLHILHILFC